MKVDLRPRRRLPCHTDPCFCRGHILRSYRSQVRTSCYIILRRASAPGRHIRESAPEIRRLRLRVSGWLFASSLLWELGSSQGEPLEVYLIQEEELRFQKGYWVQDCLLHLIVIV